MPTITLNIPAAHATRVGDAFKGLYGIPKIPDAAWTPGPGEDETDRPVIDEFTPAEWVKERLMRFIKIDTVAEWERRQAMPGLNPDDGVVTG